MSRTVGLALSVSLLVGAVRADEAGEARALLERALKALGGAEALAKHEGVTWQSKGTITRGGEKGRIRDTWSVRGPDKLRWEGETDDEGAVQKVTIVLNGTKAWARGGAGAAVEVPREYFVPIRDLLYVLRVGDAPLALRDKAFHLSPLGELKIDGQAAVGVKVQGKGRPDVDLFFDKESLRPLRVALRGKLLGSAEEQVLTFHYRNYKEFGGRQYATRLTLQADGKELFDLERRDFQAVEKLDDATFARPKD